MIFDKQYLTYDEYINLGGEKIGETPFNLLEFEARRKIDIKTQNRLDINDIPKEVKLCEYSLINSIKEYSNSLAKSNSNISSESIDGYSVSYLTPNTIKEIVISKNKELDDIIRTYLLGIKYNNEHLLFVGVE